MKKDRASSKRMSGYPADGAEVILESLQRVMEEQGRKEGAQRVDQFLRDNGYLDAPRRKKATPRLLAAKSGRGPSSSTRPGR